MFGAGTGEAAQALGDAYGLIIQSAPGEFLVVARGASLTFSSPDAQVELDAVHEGRFQEGRWLAGRTLNGDERYFMFPKDDLRTVRIRLLRRTAPP